MLLRRRRNCWCQVEKSEAKMIHHRQRKGKKDRKELSWRGEMRKERWRKCLLQSQCGIICISHILKSMTHASIKIKIRRRFCLPDHSFLDFVEEAREGDWFPRWSGTDAAGKKASPLELLILGSFRYLGRGFTFDDLEEATGISEEVHRFFSSVHHSWEYNSI